MRLLSFGGLAGLIFGIPTHEFKKESIGEQGRGALEETSGGSEEARMEKGGDRGEPLVSCARGTRGLRRPSFDARSGRPIGPPLVKEYERAWKDHLCIQRSFDASNEDRPGRTTFE